MRLHLAVILGEEALAPLPIRRVRRHGIVRVVEAAVLPVRAFAAASEEVGVERADVLSGWPAAILRLDVVATGCHLGRVHRVQLSLVMLLMLLLLLL